MTIYGYARVSTDGQTLDAQVSALKAAGAEKVYQEKASGAKTDRAALARAMAALGPGDVLLVTPAGQARQVNQGPSKRIGDHRRQAGRIPIAWGSLGGHDHAAWAIDGNRPSRPGRI
jgi:hypothetical protein